MLLALGVPCSAQLATILGILGGISFYALLTLFGVVMLQVFLVGFLAARVLPASVRISSSSSRPCGSRARQRS